MKIYEHNDWTVVGTKEASAMVRQLVKHKTRELQYERILSNKQSSVTLDAWLQLIEQADQSLRCPQADYMRRAIRVIAMIGELHKLGFQRIRFHTQDRGIGLRLYITTSDNIKRDHGAEMVSHINTVVYFSGMKNNYFDWTDATTDNARQLAAKFIVRFPELVERGRGLDWPYAGWFHYMLGLAERGWFPIVWLDYDETDDDHIHLTNAPSGISLLKPPGGEG